MKPIQTDFFHQVPDHCACPRCFGRLTLGQSCFICLTCKASYPVSNTIPDFLVTRTQTQAMVEGLSCLYDRASETYKGSPRSCGYAGDASFLHRLNIFKKWIDFSGINHLKILDIGCGTGLMTQALAGTNQVWGVDISAKLLSIAREKGIRTLRGSADALPFKTGTFDLVVCMGVLPYYTDPDPIVSQICRVVKPGGNIVLTSTTDSWLIQWVRALKNLSWKKSQLKRLYSPHDLETSLEKQGACVLDTCLGFNHHIISCKNESYPFRFRLLARVAAAWATLPEK